MKTPSVVFCGPSVTGNLSPKPNKAVPKEFPSAVSSSAVDVAASVSEAAVLTEEPNAGVLRSCLRGPAAERVCVLPLRAATAAVAPAPRGCQPAAPSRPSGLVRAGV